IMSTAGPGPSACSFGRAGGGVMEQAGSLEPGVEAGELPVDGWWQQGQVGNALQLFGDRPEIMLSRHPVQVVEAGQVDGAAVAPERALPGQVVVMLEIRHGELTQGAVDGLAVTQPGEFAGSNGTPQSPAPEDRDHMILVAHRGQVHD